MIVIPAIDLLNGKCVRLKQGDYNQVTVYSDNPVAVAKSFEDAGAKLIHVVDLNGAKDGSLVNLPVIEEILKAVSCPIEVGGGIREVESAKKYVDLGVKRIIIGTKACEKPEFFDELTKNVYAEIIAGIDAKNGKVATKGWTELTNVTAKELASELEKRKASAIIYTDITKDGMRVGPNIDATMELVKTVSIPVIASGGVSSEEDIINISKFPIWGVIVGKAIYEGDINLQKILKLF